MRWRIDRDFLGSLRPSLAEFCTDLPIMGGAKLSLPQGGRSHPPTAVPAFPWFSRPDRRESSLAPIAGPAPHQGWHLLMTTTSSNPGLTAGPEARFFLAPTSALQRQY